MAEYAGADLSQPRALEVQPARQLPAVKTAVLGLPRYLAMLIADEGWTAW